MPPFHRLGCLYRRVRWLVALLALLPPGLAATAAAPTSLEYQVKAAFIFNFTSFVAWPASAFASPSSPLDICIVGHDPFDGMLDQTVAGEAVNGHPVIVSRRTRINDVNGCQIVFVAQTGAHDAQLVRATNRKPVLTIGETEAFWQNGGIITFAIDGGHVRFDINREAAARNGLQLSSKLLQAARRLK